MKTALFKICTFLIFFALCFNIASLPAKADETAVTWVCESKSAKYETYGPWKEAVRKYTNGKSNGSISCDLNKTVSSTYSGSLQVPIKKIQSFASMQHSIGKSFSVSVSDSESMKGLRKGTYAILWRKVYLSRTIVQRQYIKLDGKRIKLGKKTVISKDFRCISFRLKRISKRDRT